jgi:hypothetical protein
MDHPKSRPRWPTPGRSDRSDNSAEMAFRSSQASLKTSLKSTFIISTIRTFSTPSESGGQSFFPVIPSNSVLPDSFLEGITEGTEMGSGNDFWQMLYIGKKTRCVGGWRRPHGFAPSFFGSQTTERFQALRGRRLCGAEFLSE